MAKIPGGKVSAPKVPTPKRDAGFVPHPPDRRLFPQVYPPRIKPIKTRIYAKGFIPEDPSKYTGFGFGATGMTGES